MKKLLKAIAALALAGLIFSCDVTLLIPEAEITYNTVYVTNNVNGTIDYMYVIPADEFNSYYTVENSNYYKAFSHYRLNETDILGTNRLYDGKAVTVDFNDFYSTDLIVVAFEDTGSDYGTIDGISGFMYIMNINNTVENFSLNVQHINY